MPSRDDSSDDTTTQRIVGFCCAGRRGYRKEVPKSRQSPDAVYESIVSTEHRIQRLSLDLQASASEKAQWQDEGDEGARRLLEADQEGQASSDDEPVLDHLE